jgi:hypothetical protein
MLHVYAVNDLTGAMRPTDLSVTMDVDIVELIEVLNHYAPKGHHYRYVTDNMLRDKAVSIYGQTNTTLRYGGIDSPCNVPHSDHVCS